MTSNAFLGCQVRRVNSGEAGRIRGMSESGVEIGWEPKTGVIPTEQTFAPGDATFATGIEVYTLDRGWIPAGELPGFNESTEQATMPNEKPAIRSGLSNLLGEIRKALEAAPQALAEKESPHWPFRHTKSRQGGPNKEFDIRGDSRADDWECTCSNYKCSCKGIGDNKGAKKRVRIPKAYKKRYNKAYKAWIAAGRP